MRLDLGRLQKAHFLGSCLHFLVQMPLKEKCLEDDQSNTGSAEDVENLLFSKVHQNNRSKLMIIVFSHHCAFLCLSTTILHTILTFHTLRSRFLKSSYLKWRHEMKHFCSTDEKSKMLFQRHSCPGLSQSCSRVQDSSYKKVTFVFLTAGEKIQRWETVPRDAKYR